METVLTRKYVYSASDIMENEKETERENSQLEYAAEINDDIPAENAKSDDLRQLKRLLAIEVARKESYQSDKMS